MQQQWPLRSLSSPAWSRFSTWDRPRAVHRLALMLFDTFAWLLATHRMRDRRID